MRNVRLIAIIVPALLLVLTSCVGRQFALLPAGSGQGKYAGNFKDPGAVDLGAFTLKIEDSGAVRGSGTLNAYTVSMRGVLTVNHDLVGYLTEEESQRTGKFNGRFDGGAFSGTWEFDPTGTQTIQGSWDAVLNP